MKTPKYMHHTCQKVFAVVILVLLSSVVGYSQNNKLNLAGNWKFQLDSTDVGVANQWYSGDFTQEIQLPGTTDDAGFGVPNQLEPKLEKPQVLRLTRRNSYVGPAWYSRNLEIPRGWKGKIITLKLERVIWETKVWVNGVEIPAMQESLSTPHYFDLTDYVGTGSNQLSMRIDNRKKYDISVKDMAHAYTNETQIMWNGVIGKISCTAEDKVNITDLQIYPDIKKNIVKVNVTVANHSAKAVKGKIRLKASLLNSNKSLKTTTISFKATEKLSTFEMIYPMGNETAYWDEFNPNLYTLTAELKAKCYKSTKTQTFGMRSLTGNNARLQMNGKDIFLRGTLECAIFPLRGYPPMDKEGWIKIYTTAREWGLNHLRFHSWCPPKAAFEAADEMGFYLQVELPLWSLSVNKDEPTNQFLFNEAQHIIREYGNHPSFCFWSLGNELQPDFKFLNSFVQQLKEQDPRHLYTNTSFSFESGHGKWPEPNDDFFITQYTNKGWVRGQGVFDSEAPTFTKDYSASVKGMTVPLITHEIGQYAVYPNLKEIEKYKGVLDPLNFKAVKADLEMKGRLHKADDYLMASGKLAALLYKEEIERAMKTKGVSGFQLLDLHDFPGQGTALVGLLDAFWESKGLIEPAEFRQFSAAVVPLMRFEKATYTNKELFNASFEIANYGNQSLIDKKLSWELLDGSTLVKSGQLVIPTIHVGEKTVAGEISVSLSEITKATSLKVVLKIEGADYKNSWQIWVYPTETTINSADILVTANKQEALDALALGRKVLYSPPVAQINGLEGKFVQVFWSPVHFPNQPGTMGLLLDPMHKAFEHFPTEMHTNWQWWDLCKQSKTIDIGAISGATAIVENVDNFMKNRELCSVFETNVAGGRLIFSSMDLMSDIKNRPAAKQLLYSLLEYMKSEHFKPVSTINPDDLRFVLIE